MTETYKPAIVVVGYNRPQQTLRLLESIGLAKYESFDITLVVSIDKSDLSDEVATVAESFKWDFGKKIIRRFSERQGLRKHIISCGDLSEIYGSVIILEDDLVVAEDYYLYCCQAHKFYSDSEIICGVSLYNHQRNQFANYRFQPKQNLYDTYLGQMVVTWGESWTKKQWSNFKQWYLSHEDKLPSENLLIPDEISGWSRSWGKYFASYIAENNLFYVYPFSSRTTCFSEVGEHNLKFQTSISQVPLMNGVPTDGYRFATIDNAVRYDSFFELILSEKTKVGSVSGKDIAFDLNGMKRFSGGKKYIVSCQKLDSEVIDTFGLAMRPVEDNILNNVKGQHFKFYQLKTPDIPFKKQKKKAYRYPQSYDRLRYEHNDLTWRVLLQYFVNEITNVIVSHLKRLFN